VRALLVAYLERPRQCLLKLVVLEKGTYLLALRVPLEIHDWLEGEAQGDLKDLLAVDEVRCYSESGEADCAHEGKMLSARYAIAMEVLVEDLVASESAQGEVGLGLLANPFQALREWS